MAAHASFMILSFLTLLFTLFSSAATVSALSTEHVDDLLFLLRARGHELFANAISTSDLLFDILSLPSLTLLAPTDPTLFALDMTSAPPFYISTLRLHVLPLRLSWSQLRLLSNGSFLPTILTSRELLVLRRRQVNTFRVDGSGGDGSVVEVVMPGLYYTSDVAVHGLGGIITFRSKIGSSASLSPPPVPRFNTAPTNSRNRTVFFPPVPRINTTSPGNNRNRTVFFPAVPRILEDPPINHTIRSPPPAPTTPSNHTNRIDFSLANGTAAVSPSPGPAILENHSQIPVRSPESVSVLTGSTSSEMALSPETRAEESKARKMSEILASGEMCAVG